MYWELCSLPNVMGCDLPGVDLLANEDEVCSISDLVPAQALNWQAISPSAVVHEKSITVVSERYILASSFVSIVHLSTAAVNFSCVPLLRAARAAVNLDWQISSMAAASYPSSRVRSWILYLLKISAHYACRPFTRPYLPSRFFHCPLHVLN